MYDEWSQFCRLLSWWAHENARWHRLRDSNLSNAFSDWMAPALTNVMHESTGGGGPIDFRIEGVLACVYKVVMSAVMSQIRWF